MGYSNEFASLNQSSEIKDYCNKKVLKRLRTIYKQHKKMEIEANNIPKNNIYQPEPEHIPAISVDGGICTLFSGESSEIKIIKVSAGYDEDDAPIFGELDKPVYFHIFSGILKWVGAAGLNPKTKQPYKRDELVSELVDDFCSLSIIQDMFSNLKLDIDPFKEELHSFISHRVKKKSNVDDVIREIMEWALIVNYAYKYKKEKKMFYQKGKEIPYLFIKDGSLFAGKYSLSQTLLEAVVKFLEMEDFIIIGVVKASRFVSDENSWGKIVKAHSSKIKGNGFFKLTKELEEKIDKEETFYKRYFLSLFDGASIFEIQIPKQHEENVDHKETIFDGLSSLVSVRHGGSIVTNSFAHELASISAYDADVVTKELKNDIYDELKDLLKELNSIEEKTNE